VHFTELHFDLSEMDQAVTLIHERAHTILRIPEHSHTGDSPVCIAPNELKKLGFDVA